jgi:hypothetical protein
MKAARAEARRFRVSTFAARPARRRQPRSITSKPRDVIKSYLDKKARNAEVELQKQNVGTPALSMLLQVRDRSQRQADVTSLGREAIRQHIPLASANRLCKKRTKRCGSANY